MSQVSHGVCPFCGRMLSVGVHVCEPDSRARRAELAATGFGQCDRCGRSCPPTADGLCAACFHESEDG